MKWKQTTSGWPEFWYHGQKPPWWAVVLAKCYGVVLSVRRWLYHHGWLTRTRLPVPVVIVGNRVVGGSGKTPLLMALTHDLQQRGWRVGMISRGYGRQDKQVRAVTANSTVEAVGDEPLLLYHALHVPVYVGAARVQAAQALLAAHSVDVILSDDGWQHLALAHDYVIEVVDDVKGYGNKYLLPAGPLREPLTRLPAAQLRLYNGRDFYLKPTAWLHIASQTYYPLTHLTGAVVAMAGIGNPQRFFDTLTTLGYELKQALPLADHQALSLSVVQQWDQSDYPLVMTAKDAVRCQAFAQPHWWALWVETTLTADYFNDLHASLEQWKYAHG